MEQLVSDKEHPTTALAARLRRAGQPATVRCQRVEGFVLCTVDNIELEPRQVVTLAKALRLIAHSNDRFHRALCALEEYAQ